MRALNIETRHVTRLVLDVADDAIEILVPGHLQQSYLLLAELVLQTKGTQRDQI